MASRKLAGAALGAQTLQQSVVGYQCSGFSIALARRTSAIPVYATARSRDYASTLSAASTQHCHAVPGQVSYLAGAMFVSSPFPHDRAISTSMRRRQGVLSRVRSVSEVAAARAPALEGVFAVKYTYVENILEKRTPFRAEHLALCCELQAEGAMLLGGALGDPPTHGLLVLRAAGAAEVEARFVRRDPYVLNGLVTAWEIQPWTVVVGSLVDQAKGV